MEKHQVGAITCAEVAVGLGRRLVKNAKTLLGLLALTMLGPVVAQAEPGPFAGYQGSWSGNGTISTSSGSERIRCRASYAVDGTGVSLRQNMTCASDSYRFQVVSDIIASGERLSGSWSEVTRGANGSVSGSVSGGHFRANVSGGGFSAGIGVDASATRQSVTITPKGTDVNRISVVLQRGG